MKPDKLSQEVAAAIGMQKAEPLPDPDDMATQESGTTLGIAGVGETHNPLDIPFGHEVNETIMKQVLETKLEACGCKNKNKRKA